MSNQHKKNSFYGGVVILTMSTAIIKIIGALYKLPLTALLSDQAFGDFGGAYNLYSFFLTISTAGLPVALSKSVSEANALGRQNQVSRIFKVAFFSFLVMGIISFLCMSLFAPFVSSVILRNEKALYCVIALSPAVLCTCCCSAFRGYAQGHMNMVPTAISQVIEAVCKLFVGMGLAFLVLRLALQPPDFGNRMAAVGAIIGVSVGSILSVCFLVYNHIRTRRRTKTTATDVADPSKTILTRLLKLAIPITLSSSTMAIVTIIDTNLVMDQLQTIFAQIQTAAASVSNTGGLFGIFDKSMALVQTNTAAALLDSAVNPVLDSARSLYGIYQKCMSIYNLPFSLMVPLTACIIPAVSAFRAKRDHLGSRRISESALRVSALIALPAGLGLFALGGPIMTLLTLGKTDSTIAGPLLSILGIASIFVCFQLICTSILQAHGMVNLPILTVIIGGIVKIAVNYSLVGNPNILIYGAPVGTLCCFLVVALLNLMIIKRVIPNPPNYTKAFVKPIIASVFMGVAAWATYGLLSGTLGLGNTLSTMGAILVGMAIYLVLVLVLRVISKEDLELMPKGEKIAKLLHIK